TSKPIPIIVDEAVYEEWDDRVEGAATTVASLDAEQASGNILRTQSLAIPNVPLPRGSGLGGRPRVNTLGSGEDSLELIKELMETCTKLSARLLALEESKTAQDLVIKRLKLRVKKLEKKKRKASTPQPMKKRLFRVRVESSAEESLDKDDASKQGRNGSDKTEELNLSDKGSAGTKNFEERYTEKDVSAAGIAVTTVGAIPKVSAAGPSTVSTAGLFEDELMTMADTLVAIRRTRPRKTSVVIHDLKEEPRRTLPEPTVQSQQTYKDKCKAKMVELEEPMKIKRRYQERVVEEEATNVVLLEEWDNTQAMMDADYELAARLSAEGRAEIIIKERSKLFVELMEKRKKYFAKLREEERRMKPQTKTQRRNQMCTYLKNMAGAFKAIDLESSKKRSGEELKEENIKKQKLEDDVEKTKLKECLEIVSDSDKAIRMEPLATRSPIVDWKIHSLRIVSCYIVERADGWTKMYKFFSEMLKEFDRQDLLDMYRLVKEKYKTKKLEAEALVFWGNFMTMFEPDENDEIWKNQEDHTLIE
ncbi:hypothetical protein Tco_1464364, partial [Tanacetum coccineum]